MSERVLEAIQTKFGGHIVQTHSAFGDDTAIVTPASWKEVFTFLRHEPALRFDMLVDLCGVDYPGRSPRIEVVVHLYSTSLRHRVRIKTAVGNPNNDDETIEGCELPSISDLWPGANWFERETFDLMGVRFVGHPDLRRILMYPEFEGHPLRKDYPADRTQPLIPYRTEAEAGVPLEKLAPFGRDEGMPFGRNNVKPGPSTEHGEN